MPHDRYFGIAAAEIAEQRPDRDLFARAYAMALGDAEKTKAIYIGIRAERLEEEALASRQREAEMERARAQQERERAKRQAASRTRPVAQKIDVAPTPKPEPQVTPPLAKFSDPEIAKAVQAMRDALAASKFKKS